MLKDTTIYRDLDSLTLIPRISATTRKNCDLTPSYLIGGLKWINNPLISSPMDTVTDSKMALELKKTGTLGIVHRYQSLNTLVDLVKKDNEIPIAVGTLKNHRAEINALLKAGAKILCVDVAHGAHINALDTVKYIKDSNIEVIGGNVSSVECAMAVKNAGTNVFRVGIGPGSACLTRKVTGCGTPLPTTIALIKKEINDCVILSDGGMRHTGDIAKILSAGASYVILGGLISALRSSPAKTVYRNKLPCYKVYRGMSSKKALLEGNGKSINNLMVEGREKFIQIDKRTIYEFVHDVKKALYQAMFYTGVTNLEDMYRLTELININ